MPFALAPADTRPTISSFRLGVGVPPHGADVAMTIMVEMIYSHLLSYKLYDDPDICTGYESAHPWRRVLGCRGFCRATVDSCL